MSFLNVSRFQNCCTIDTNLSKFYFRFENESSTKLTSVRPISLCDYAHSKLNWHQTHRYGQPLYTHHGGRVKGQVDVQMWRLTRQIASLVFQNFHCARFVVGIVSCAPVCVHACVRARESKQSNRVQVVLLCIGRYKESTQNRNHCWAQSYHNYFIFIYSDNNKILNYVDTETEFVISYNFVVFECVATEPIDVDAHLLLSHTSHRLEWNEWRMLFSNWCIEYGAREGTNEIYMESKKHRETQGKTSITNGTNLSRKKYPKFPYSGVQPVAETVWEIQIEFALDAVQQFAVS